MADLISGEVLLRRGLCNKKKNEAWPTSLDDRTRRSRHSDARKQSYENVYQDLTETSLMSP
jgi:hypothetical protein